MNTSCAAYFQNFESECVRVPEGSRYAVTVELRNIHEVAIRQSVSSFSGEYFLEQLLENSGTVEYSVLNTIEGKKFVFDELSILTTDKDIIVSSISYPAIHALLSNVL
jgi:hypothetical protein